MQMPAEAVPFKEAATTLNKESDATVYALFAFEISDPFHYFLC